MVDQVVHCEANDNYTLFYLKNGNKVTACRTLKEIEDQLEEYSSFLRIHHSFIVNLNEEIIRISKPRFGNGLGANKRLLKAKKSNKGQMKSNWEMRQLRETRVQRMVVTSQYKKYSPAMPVGFRGIGDGLVTADLVSFLRSSVIYGTRTFENAIYFNFK